MIYSFSRKRESVLALVNKSEINVRVAELNKISRLFEFERPAADG